MAKSLLADYKLKGDVIDRLAPERAAEAEHEAEPSPVLFHNSSGDLPDESPPVGLAQGDDAITMIDSVPSDELTCERDGLFQVFTVGEISYRLGGVKSLFVTSLRVNIRASNGEASYYDSLDLYMARSRGGFAAALHRAWGAEPSRVERDRMVPVSEVARDFVARHLGAKIEDAEAWVFAGSRGATRGRHIASMSVSERFRVLLRRFGMDKVELSTHSLRHSTATHLLENGASVRHVQELLGHRYIESTVCYTHVMTDGLTKVYRR